MSQKKWIPPDCAREEELLKAYKWNFDAMVHEFNLLHTRAGQYINTNWMMVAMYVPVLGVALANLGNQDLRNFASALLGVAALTGLIVSATSIAGIEQAVTAIKRYILNQCKIETELGKDHSFVCDVTLGRTPDSTGCFREHESSLRFHRVLPWLLIVLWLALGGFAFWLVTLPAPPVAPIKFEAVGPNQAMQPPGAATSAPESS
jgi:hypothetical protein